MGINKSYRDQLDLENIRISGADLINSIREGNEYVLSSLDGVIEREYHYVEGEDLDEKKEHHDRESLQKYLDEKVKYGHINKRIEKDGEVIYFASKDLIIINNTQKITNNILLGKKLFNPNERIDFNEDKAA